MGITLFPNISKLKNLARCLLEPDHKLLRMFRYADTDVGYNLLLDCAYKGTTGLVDVRPKPIDRILAPL